MQRQLERYAIDLPVELLAPGYRQRVAMQDVSRGGMFLAVGSQLPLGAQMAVALDHIGTRVVCAARVMHCLSDADARPLGRVPGIGVELQHPSERFVAALDRVLRRARTATPPDRMHIVVADREPRLVERLSTSLANVGFTVATATTGLEVLAACMRRAPDVVLVDRGLPILDGLVVRERLACHARLSAVPVIVMSSEPGDLAAAFDSGAADFIAKPFTIPEVVARTRRLARRNVPVAFAGNLGELGLPAVLTMLELEKKTGRLVLADGHAAWIDIVDGCVVDAGWTRGDGDPRSIVLALLDAAHGTFKLTTRSTINRTSDIALSITHLLLERACLNDERAGLNDERAIEPPLPQLSHG